MSPHIVDDSSETGTQIVSKCHVAPPLKRSHFLCFSSHRSFLKTRNTHHSLPCMTCKREDFPHLWRCTFCFLRICEDCFDTLCDMENRSLQKLLETLGVDAEIP
ncbi:conserved hypothetical protein [Coccidioides posadasii str. Silveira]|nr:conserved hypothetical protein [Coccidioides posadasii str. Silveira]